MHSLFSSISTSPTQGQHPRSNAAAGLRRGCGALFALLRRYCRAATAHIFSSSHILLPFRGAYKEVQVWRNLKVYMISKFLQVSLYVSSTVYLSTERTLSPKSKEQKHYPLICYLLTFNFSKSTISKQRISLFSLIVCFPPTESVWEFLSIFAILPFSISFS